MMQNGISIKEIWRVLKPGGKAVFFEPFSGSKFLRLIRQFIPIKAELSPHERQLNLNDIDMITNPFSSSSVMYFGLLSRLDRIIKKQFVIDAISAFDFAVLKAFPFFKKFARGFVLELNK